MKALSDYPDFLRVSLRFFSGVDELWYKLTSFKSRDYFQNVPKMAVVIHYGVPQPYHRVVKHV